MVKPILWVVAWLLSGSLSAQEPVQPMNPGSKGAQAFVSGAGLRALDLAGGGVLWQALNGRQLFEPTVGEGRVFVGSSDGLFALDAHTGSLLWHRFAGKTVFSPLRVRDRLYAGALDGTLRALSATGGESLWQRRLSGWVYTPAWVDGRLVTGGSDQRLWALDARDGRPLWSAPLDQELVYRPVRAGDGVVVTTYAGTVSHHGPEGRLRWRRRDGVASVGPRVLGGRVLLAGLDGSVRLRDLNTGALLAQTELGGRIVTGPVISNQRALVTSEAGDWGVFSLMTGDWQSRGRLSPDSRALAMAVKDGFLQVDPRGLVTRWPSDPSGQ